MEMDKSKKNKYELTDEDVVSFYCSILSPKKNGVRMRDHECKKRFHLHNHYEILNISSSYGEYAYIGKKKYLIQENYFIIIPPGKLHMTQRTKFSKRLIMNFNEEYMSSIFEFLGIDKNQFLSNNVFAYSKNQIDELYQIGENIVNEMSKNGIKNLSPKLRILTAYFIEILTRPILIPEPENEEESEFSVEDVVEFIEKNYAMPINLDYLANQFAISKFMLCKMFKEKNNETINNYITKTRIKKACELLLETDSPITEISQAVGYNSPAYFSIAFKKYTDISPIKYRDNARNIK